MSLGAERKTKFNIETNEKEMSLQFKVFKIRFAIQASIEKRLIKARLFDQHILNRTLKRKMKFRNSGKNSPKFL